ncbi:MAG: hypothetical protein NT142_02320 [Planctomycetota bacterium]|nr:hypothetical protein [Planctomycetota bacterium]
MSRVLWFVFAIVILLTLEGCACRRQARMMCKYGMLPTSSSYESSQLTVGRSVEMVGCDPCSRQ